MLASLQQDASLWYGSFGMRLINPNINGALLIFCNLPCNGLVQQWQVQSWFENCKFTRVGNHYTTDGPLLVLSKWSCNGPLWLGQSWLESSKSTLVIYLNYKICVLKTTIEYSLSVSVLHFSTNCVVNFVETAYKFVYGLETVQIKFLKSDDIFTLCLPFFSISKKSQFLEINIFQFFRLSDVLKGI